MKNTSNTPDTPETSTKESAALSLLDVLHEASELPKPECDTAMEKILTFSQGVFAMARARVTA